MRNEAQAWDKEPSLKSVMIPASGKTTLRRFHFSYWKPQDWQKRS